MEILISIYVLCVTVSGISSALYRWLWILFLWTHGHIWCKRLLKWKSVCYMLTKLERSIDKKKISKAVNAVRAQLPNDPVPSLTYWRSTPSSSYSSSALFLLICLNSTLATQKKAIKGEDISCKCRTADFFKCQPNRWLFQMSAEPLTF